MFILLCSTFSFGQNYFLDHFGGTVGAVMQIGSHKNSFGLSFNGYYQDYFYQLNAGQQFLFVERDLGGRKKYLESRSSVGLMLMAGKKDKRVDPFIQPLNHQSKFRNAIGYSMIWYKDQVHTSQRSGAWGIHVQNFSLYHENDVFGGQGKDRFRTGDFRISYLYNNLRFSTGIKVWTGETSNTQWIKDGTESCPNGFKILEDNSYGNTSHGILYGGVKGAVGYNQYVSFMTGYDSELVRHFFQNKMMHDLPFMPKKYKRTTPHYPMIDEHGCVVFDKKDRRPDKWYVQLGANENWSY